MITEQSERGGGSRAGGGAASTAAAEWGRGRRNRGADETARRQLRRIQKNVEYKGVASLKPLKAVVGCNSTPCARLCCKFSFAHLDHVTKGPHPTIRTAPSRAWFHTGGARSPPITKFIRMREHSTTKMQKNITATMGLGLQRSTTAYLGAPANIGSVGSSQLPAAANSTGVTALLAPAGNALLLPLLALAAAVMSCSTCTHCWRIMQSVMMPASKRGGFVRQSKIGQT